MYVRAVPTESGEGTGSSKWRYGWLWTTVCMLGNEPRSSTRVTSVLDLWASSPAPDLMFHVSHSSHMALVFQFLIFLFACSGSSVLLQALISVFPLLHSNWKASPWVFPLCCWVFNSIFILLGFSSVLLCLYLNSVFKFWLFGFSFHWPVSVFVVIARVIAALQAYWAVCVCTKLWVL